MGGQVEEFVDDLIQTLRNPTRASIFYYLARKPDSTATEIAKNLGEHVDIVYYHLKLLKKAGLVSKPRVVVCGNYVCKYYSIRPDFKEKFVQSSRQYKARWKELSTDEMREMLIARLTVIQSIIASSIKRLGKIDSKIIERMRDERDIETEIIFCSKARYYDLLKKLKETLKGSVMETFDPIEKEYVLTITAMPKLGEDDK